jgi:hypothetical protein
MLSKQHIRRFLLAASYDRDRSPKHLKGDIETPLDTIGRMADIAATALQANWYMDRLVTGKTRVNRRVQRKLSPIIEDLEAGRTKIRLEPIRANGKLAGRRVVIERITPPSNPPRLPKLVPAADWAPFARCVSCAGQVWRSVAIRGAFHYACKSCIGLDQLPGMGARLTTKQERSGLPETVIYEDFSLVDVK